MGSSRSGGGHDRRSPLRGCGGAHRAAHDWRFGEAGRLLFLLVAALGLLARPAAAQTEVIEYYGHDALGSVRIVFTASGVATARADYEPFGEGVTIAGMPAGPLPAQQFTGQERDALERQDYFGARYYRPRHGRFAQVDPVYAGLFDPQQWNRYAYARNNPLGFVDPNGRNLEALDRPAFRVEVEYCSSCDNRFFIQMQLMWYFPGAARSGLGAGSGPDGSGEPGRGRGRVGVGPAPPAPTPDATPPAPISVPPDGKETTVDPGEGQQLITIDPKFEGKVFVKPETGSLPQEVQKGTTRLNFDGVAIPSRYPCMVFKVTGQDWAGANSVHVDERGLVTTKASNSFIGAVQWYSGGWKFLDFRKAVNQARDFTWDPLFAEACR